MRRFSNAAVGRFVLGGMAVMAVIGLVYALSTQGLRREYDVRLPKSKAISIPVYLLIPLVVYVAGLVAAWFWGWDRRDHGAPPRRRPRRVAGLIGLSALVLLVVELGLVVMHARTPGPPNPKAPRRPTPSPRRAGGARLPAEDTDLILAVHVAELLDDPVGHDLTAHLGNESINLQSVENWSGLKVADIDHAVLGLSLTNDLPVHFTLVVCARRAIDRGRCAKLKVKPQSELDGRPVYPFVMQTDLPVFRELDANLGSPTTTPWSWPSGSPTGRSTSSRGARAGPGSPAPALRHLVADRMDHRRAPGWRAAAGRGTAYFRHWHSC